MTVSLVPSTSTSMSSFFCSFWTGSEELSSTSSSSTRIRTSSLFSCSFFTFFSFLTLDVFSFLLSSFPPTSSTFLLDLLILADPFCSGALKNTLFFCLQASVFERSEKSLASTSFFGIVLLEAGFA